MIEAGVWKARACEAALGFTLGGKRQIGIDFVLLEGPNIGAHITWYGYFTDASWERTIQAMQYCGWGSSDLNDLRGIDANEVSLVIDHETHPTTGEVHARAQWVNQLGGVVMKSRMDSGQTAAFAAEMKGRIIALGASGGSKRPTRAPDPADAPDDDIPF